ncbi:PIG-L deacetylase family protein [Quadrisphaera sp. GCM10027208]|uniref:PIG-L deacetylase family protein n=1 Tax=Quadrisphaera sp. GCM10027208 TaxID=3273423 RepID=UPI003612992E
MPLTAVPRALVVAAHPDDIDFGSAGTVATWTAAGTQVTYLLCTYGDAGGFDDTPREEVPGIRAAEQRDAAAAVGVHDVRFLEGYRDGYLEVGHDLVRDLTRVIRQVRPVRLLAPSPERRWDLFAAGHHDHLACGEAAVRAVYPAARNPFAYPELLQDEGLEPWVVQELWLTAHPDTDHVVDVTDVLDRKLDALRAHRSQTAHRWDELAAQVRQAMAWDAGGPGRYAEHFKVVATG